MTRRSKPPTHERQQIQELLKQLKLPHMAAVLDDELVRLAQAGGEPLLLLHRLLEHEWRLRIERRVERRIRQSKLPERKFLANFDFDFQPSLNKSLIMQLASLRFLDKGQGILLGGNSGTGKSFLAKALALLACQQGHRVRYTTASTMLTDLYSGLADDSVEHKLKAYVLPTLLVIDELGFDRLEQDSTKSAGLFFKVIDRRYRRVASSIITTNIDFELLGQYLGDPLATASIADRMLHHSVVINIDGPSWRLKESEELNRNERDQLNKPARKTSKAKNGSKTKPTQPRKPRKKPLGP